MSAITSIESRDESTPSTNTVLLVARLLTALRLLTIGCVVIILTALAQQGDASPPWANVLVGPPLLLYVVVALVLLGILQLLPQRPMWVVELSLIVTRAPLAAPGVGRRRLTRAERRAGFHARVCFTS